MSSKIIETSADKIVSDGLSAADTIISHMISLIESPDVPPQVMLDATKRIVDFASKLHSNYQLVHKEYLAKKATTFAGHVNDILNGYKKSFLPPPIR